MGSLAEHTCWLAIGAACLLLTACCPTSLTKTQGVEVPIAVKCKTEPIEDPSLPYDALTRSATLFEKTQALLIQNHNLKAYSVQLRAGIEGCAK